MIAAESDNVGRDITNCHAESKGYMRGNNERNAKALRRPPVKSNTRIYEWNFRTFGVLGETIRRSGAVHKNKTEQQQQKKINRRSINFWHFMFDDGESLPRRAIHTPGAERGLGEHRVIIKPEQSSGACKTRRGPGKVNARIRQETRNVFASRLEDLGE